MDLALRAKRIPTFFEPSLEPFVSLWCALSSGRLAGDRAGWSTRVHRIALRGAAKLDRRPMTGEIVGRAFGGRNFYHEIREGHEEEGRESWIALRAKRRT